MFNNFEMVLLEGSWSFACTQLLKSAFSWSKIQYKQQYYSCDDKAEFSALCLLKSS